MGTIYPDRYCKTLLGDCVHSCNTHFILVDNFYACYKHYIHNTSFDAITQPAQLKPELAYNNYSVIWIHNPSNAAPRYPSTKPNVTGLLTDIAMNTNFIEASLATDYFLYVTVDRRISFPVTSEITWNIAAQFDVWARYDNRRFVCVCRYSHSCAYTRIPPADYCLNECHVIKWSIICYSRVMW